MGQISRYKSSYEHIASCIITTRLEVLLVFQVLARQLTREGRPEARLKPRYSSEKLFCRACQVAETTFLWLSRHEESSNGEPLAVQHRQRLSVTLLSMQFGKKLLQCWPYVADNLGAL